MIENPLELLKMLEKPLELIDFIIESNVIEDISVMPTNAQMKEARRFLELDIVVAEDLEQFVSVFEPRAKLRIEDNCNVTVGNNMPPTSGMNILYALNEILLKINRLNAWETHVEYELLHPFTDGNGRSGRMLWLWQMRKYILNGELPNLHFLHEFYYQALNSQRND